MERLHIRQALWRLLLNFAVLAAMLVIACVWFEMSVVSALVIGLMFLPLILFLQRNRLRH